MISEKTPDTRDISTKSPNDQPGMLSSKPVRLIDLGAIRSATMGTLPGAGDFPISNGRN